MGSIDAGEISRAFEAPGFVFAYQPVIDLTTGVVDSVEALLRWNHQTLGAIAPDVFLPLIHGAELSNELTQFCIHHALRDLAELRGIYGEDVSVAINLSHEQLTEPEWVSNLILESLADLNEPSSSLTIELVEDTTARQMLKAARAFSDLRAAGVSVLLDDFGTGASSLTALVEVGYDGLKIDRSFVKGLLTSKTARSVVEAVMSFGRNTGISVVAEGVESELTLRTLQDMGCALAQGFHLGWPRSLNELTSQSVPHARQADHWRAGSASSDVQPAIAEAKVRVLTEEFEQESLAFYVAADNVDAKRGRLEGLYERAKLLGRPADHIRSTIGRELAMLETQEQRHDRVVELAMDTHRIALRAERWHLAAEMLTYVALCPWDDIEEAGLRMDALTGALRIRSTRPMPEDTLSRVDNLIGMAFRVLGLNQQSEEWFRRSVQRNAAEATLHSAFGCVNYIAVLLDLIDESRQMGAEAPVEIMLARIDQLLRRVETNPSAPMQVVRMLECRTHIARGDLATATEIATEIDLADASTITLATMYRAHARLARASGDNADFLGYTTALVEMLDHVAWYYRIPALRLHAEALTANGREQEGAALAARVRIEEVTNYRQTLTVLFEWIRRNVALTTRFDEIFEATDRNLADLSELDGPFDS